MSSRHCMIQLMADVIGVDDTYSGHRLNDEAVWHRFMVDLFKRMDTLEDDEIRETLEAVDREEFQEWIDDPGFWAEIDEEIKRRGQIIKTLIPSPQAGTC